MLNELDTLDTTERAEIKKRLRKRLHEIEAREALYDTDFPAFASDNLKIRPKTGGDILFRLNAVQLRLHNAIEEQRARRGMVRLIVLKARQPGVSTYVEGRYYWRTSRNKGLSAFILTHKDDATDNVFAMAQRFHDTNPEAPHTGKANAKELKFDQLDSGFVVGTAGSKGTGRSRTINLFHGSEVAFWPNAEDHATGALEAVPRAEGTEIILESTANGIGGLFYNMATAAVAGKGDFEIHFIPWFEHEEYEEWPPDDWEPSPDISEYAALHGLTIEQAYWMEAKNAQMAATDGDPPDKIHWRFRQEYPGTVEEAFRASRTGSFISGDLTAKARKNNVGNQDHAPLIIGCDIATGGDGEGGDDNSFIERQGRAAGRKLRMRFNDKNTVSVANKLEVELRRLKPDKAFIDTGGGGAAVYDILCSRGWGDILELVDFGSKPRDGRKYRNKRAEIWGDMRDWFADPGGAEIPDDDKLDGDITAPAAKESPSSTAITLESKKEIRKNFGFSPDDGDALATTFAAVVKKGARSKVNPLDDAGTSDKHGFLGA